MATASPSPLASSVEKTNGTKLSRLLIDGGTTVLRNAFDRYHPPAYLAADLNSNYSILDNLLRKRILNRHQWGKLFPPGGAVPDSNTFDITLLFLLLTTICGLSPPLSGWHAKPSSGDNSLEANLARVKFFRNELYGHVTSSGVDTASFSSLWQDISSALISLGLDQAVVDRLKTEHGGEEDYLDVLIEWADSEEDIKTQLKDIRQSQTMAEKTMEEVYKTQLELKEELSQALSKTQDFQESFLLLDEVRESQSKTKQDVGEIRESLHEVKRQVINLAKRRHEQADEVLRTLVKSEFRGDIEYHAQKFQEGTRQWVFTSIEAWLDDRSSPHRVMVISGNAGMGKTVLSAVVAQRTQKAGRLFGSHFCQHNNSRYRDPRLMLQSLACHLSHAMPDYKDKLVKQLSRNLGKNLNSMGIEELFALLFKEPLSTVDDPGINSLIVIDGLDESEYQGRNELLNVIRNHFSLLPDWIRILITTRPERNITEALRHLEPIELEQKQEENLKDIQLLFETQLSKKIGEEHKQVVLNELVKKSEGVFIYAYFIVDFIQKNVSSLTPNQLENVLPSGISSVYLSYFKRLENELCKELNADEELFLRFLCALTASREPLPIEFIAKILNGGVKRSLTAQRKVNKSVASISTLLPVREGRLHFFHKSIKDWLVGSSPYGQHDFTVDETEGHDILSNLCASELESIKRKGVHGRQFTNTEIYALHHAGQHLLELNDKSKICSKTAELSYQCVTNLEIIYAKLCVKSTSATEDLLSLQSGNLGLLKEERNLVVTSLLSLLRKHYHILIDHPHLFFQCLINEGIPELSSTAASILESTIPKIPFMKYIDNEERKGADKARFYCSDKVACFDVSPDGAYMVCECRDGTIHLWSLQTGNRIWVRPTITKKEFYSGYPDDSAYRRVGNCSLSFYRSVTFHPHGKSVITGTLQFVYTISGERKDLFPNSECKFSNFVFCKNRREILTDSIGEPKKVALWNMANGQECRGICWDEDISCFTISEDGSLVAISEVTCKIFLVDLVNLSARLILKTSVVACGLMHFTSSENKLFCGFLSFDWEEHCNSYKGFFYGYPTLLHLTVNDDTDMKPSRPTRFFSWPYKYPSDTLNVLDFTWQFTKFYWVRNMIQVMPVLKAGSYLPINHETALVGSPTCKCVVMWNVHQEVGAFDKHTRRDAVKKIVFSHKGKTIFSITSDTEVTVTLLRTSIRELDIKVFPYSLSLFPTRDGVVLLKSNGEAELWDFELSTCLRPLPKLTRYTNVSSISDELIACWTCTCYKSGDYEDVYFDMSWDASSDTSDEWLEFQANQRKTLEIDFLDVTSTDSMIVSSLNTDLDGNEEILSISCSNTSQVLVCTSRESEIGSALLKDVTVSLRKNGRIVWKKGSIWVEPTGINACLLCSPKNDVVVTWNSLDEGLGLHILNADTGDTLHILLADQKDIIDCKFVDDEFLVCCSGDNFLRLFNVRSGDLLSVLDIGERLFSLGACLYQPVVAVGQSGRRIKFVHVELPTESRKETKLPNKGELSSS